MRTVTAIQVQKKNPNRVNIYLDEEFAFGLSRITAAWLTVGQSLSEERIATLQAEDAREAALQRALHFLSYRARSADEVRRNLLRHEFAEDVIAETLSRLERSGLIGDDQFARAWVENRNTFRPRSRRALSMELRQKGLSDEVIHSALADSGDENALALEAARKYGRRLQGLDWREFRTRLGGHLGRRGFGYDVISTATRALWQETHPAEPSDSDYEDNP
jgi:regulatory protein